MLASVLSVSLLVSLLAYAYHVLAQFQQQQQQQQQSLSSIDSKSSKNVLILTAHPDDECMFFGPTITALRDSKTRVHVLCLSTETKRIVTNRLYIYLLGNADGLGATRKKELTRSCQVLGIPPVDVKALDHGQVNLFSFFSQDLQDGMKNTWSPTLIAGIVKDYVTKHKIDTIITFDDYGVSGHPNHIAAYKGAQHFVNESCSNNKKVRLYRLSSILLPRKYIGIGDLVFMAVEQRLFPDRGRDAVLFVSSPSSYLVTHKAMRRHVSQLVWFRWLYVTFSRYMFVNQLVEVTPPV
ncbi:putative deacetylase LmbE-like domain-containing protein [Zychaea mexicana]|uniref:putative deacetylase LmbE-like domain-containing protein n=1 Tax=Zychaea mexicana TaxID=64656 RepID=UPI0022FE2513|nr:putative deacetylase LmbE-like domain-containing protein [Zychaea mexicana]KAI9488859.1 putative deacetylase LmbE-like domain-containing protein [Zychaea mexicana]